MRLARLIAWALGLLACAACAGQPGDGTARGGGAGPAAPVWPARAAVLVRGVEVGPWTLRWVSPLGLGGLEADKGDAALVAEALGGEPGAIDFEGFGSVVVRMPEGELPRTARLAGKPEAAFEVLTADARGDGRYQLQRTWFALYEPRGEARGEMVVLLPGMFGTPEPVIDPLVGTLRDRGWHVLRMLTHSSRFTEKREFMIDGEDPAAIAGDVAGELGDRAAECAIATEAVCAHIAAALPGVPVGERIGLGMSGGGMILATVMAREHDAYRRAVYIGAGCDFASIAMESNYADWIDSVRVVREGVPDGEVREAFTEAYRARAGLDSYSTAPLVADIPTLMIHGELDQAVPAEYGDLLWRRLGEPERWSVAATHETLFLAYLPGKFGELADWMEGRGDP